ncbi:Hypothetical protein PHPALM_10203 [Phytophthora palmivora]|uniref:FYVE-type domain-containing protein n=1 Tax=Phytophthora palmivora TaxID=4796 RepID=A0A2P4Y5C8_9STRA|nr:Hypothetical protein PHPALM_10203 [Phytophthora palmivora]
MAFFKLKKTEAEKAQQRTLKELERVAKAQRKHAAKEHKAQQARLKQQNKEAKRQEKQARKEAKQAQKEAQKSHQQAVKVAKKASKTRVRLARKAEKERRRSHRRQMRRTRSQARRDVAAGGVAAPPFAKSAGCFVCGKKFGKALHRRRHHCRQCRESCCLQCTSRTRRSVPQYGLQKPQKICVVCETLVNAENGAPREPAEAVLALAARGASRRAPSTRRPHSAPLPPTGVTVEMPPTTRGRGRARSTKSKGGSIWTLPIRPLLKRKKSAEQLRNRKLDMDLQIEKRAMFGGRAIELQPQAVAPPAP